MKRTLLPLRSLLRRPVREAFSAQFAPFSGSVLSRSQNNLFLSTSIGMYRTFKTTPILSAKDTKGKGKKSGKGAKSDDNNEISLPSVADVGKQMDSRLAHLKDEFSKMHAGKNSADMFNHLQVPGYGGLAETGQISLKGGNRLTINCYDPTLVKAVADCIRDCGMSLNPTIEGGAVVVLIPKASAEARTEMVKLAGKAAEKVKQEIRQIRKVSMDDVKKLKSQVSEDDSRKLMKEIDTVTERKVDTVTAAFKAKEKEILD
ncbi:frr [Symbiodinium microadriaticum]|nr:frr [Symbiodinium microadriaticum]